MECSVRYCDHSPSVGVHPSDICPSTIFLLTLLHLQILTLSQTTNWKSLKTTISNLMEMVESSPNGQKTLVKREIARYKQFLLFPQCFQKECMADTWKSGLVCERVNQSSPNLDKMYMTIRSRMSSIMELIGPKLSKLSALELENLPYLTMFTI